MLPAGDVGRAVGPLAVADGKVDDLQVEFCRAEDQVEVAKGVEIAEIGTVGGDILVIFPPHDLGAAERILDGLPQ